MKLINTQHQVKTLKVLPQWEGQGAKEELFKAYVREFEFLNQDINIELVNWDNENYNNIGNNGKNIIYENIKINKPIIDVVLMGRHYEEVAKLTGDPSWQFKYMVNFADNDYFIKNTRLQILKNTTNLEYGSHFPGPFIEGQYYTLWCNTNLADKIGMEIKKTEMTADDFMSYIKAVNDYNQRNPGDVIIAMNQYNNWNWSYIWSFHLFLSALQNNKLGLTKGFHPDKYYAWIKTMHYLEELGANNIYARNDECLRYSEKNSYFIEQENSLFMAQGSWMFNVWEGIYGDKASHFVPVEFPVFQPMNTYPCDYEPVWGVFNHSENKEEGIRFLNGFFKSSFAEDWTKITKTPTGIKTPMSELFLGQHPVEFFSEYIMNRYSEQFYKIGYTQFENDVMGFFTDSLLLVQPILDGKVNAAEAQKWINAHLSKKQLEMLSAK
ncbi:MAG: hypothetical protein ACERKD_07570 [Prolixibacteraceae bacterium]